MLKISFVGDCMLGRLMNQSMPHHFTDTEEDLENRIHAHNILQWKRPNMSWPLSYRYPWGDTLPVLLDSDARIINLETSVTCHKVKFPDKTFNFRMHPGNIEILTAANVTSCALANNHILDFGVPGMRETVQTLDSVGIFHAGAGENRDEAFHPAVLEVKGTRILHFSFSDHGSCYKNPLSNEDLWAASDTHPGFNFIDPETYSVNSDLLHLSSRMTEEKEAHRADLTVVSIHWGPNYRWKPSAQFQRFAHFLIDRCGVDIIHGHSAHHVQGIEVHQGKLIMYGLGDFVDDYAVDKEYRNNIGMLCQLSVDSNSKQLKALDVFPTKIGALQVNLMTPNTHKEDYKWFENTLRPLCDIYGTKMAESRNANCFQVSI